MISTWGADRTIVELKPRSRGGGRVVAARADRTIVELKHCAAFCGRRVLRGADRTIVELKRENQMRLLLPTTVLIEPSWN